MTSCRDLSDPGIEPGLSCLLHWQVDPLSAEPSGKSLVHTLHLINRQNHLGR